MKQSGPVLIQCQKKYFKLNRRGNVVKIAQEHYLRRNISCGSLFCEECLGDKPLEKVSPYIIVNANTIEKQIDLLETDAFKNTIYLETVVDEVRSRSYSTYSRIKKLLDLSGSHCFCFANEHLIDTYIDSTPKESISERNERAITIAIQWLIKHFNSTNVEFLLIVDTPPEKVKDNRIDNNMTDSSNDNNNYNLLIQSASNFQVMTIQEYADRMVQQYPNIVDMIVNNDSPCSKDSIIFKEYYSQSEIKTGIINEKIFSGCLRLFRNFSTKGKVSIKRGNSTLDIIVKGKENLNRAIDGDIVFIELIEKSLNEDEKDDSEIIYISDFMEENVSDEKQGRIVGISKRNWRNYSCTLEPSISGGSNVLCIPWDRRIPKIRIETTQVEMLLDHYFQVNIDSWPLHSAYPRGHFIKTLGKIGDITTETTVILLEHNVTITPWSQSQLDCLPNSSYSVSNDNDISNRVDYRKTRRVFSIDPPGCTDIDDALHIHHIDNSTVCEIGVHIADVSYYVDHDSALDQEASRRGNTFYLVNHRIHMLPDRLSSDICSLLQGMDRLAFSVIWNININTAEIISTKFHKSVIHSKAAFTYSQAQERIDRVIDNIRDDEVDKMLTYDIQFLNKIAIKLREKRLQKGALVLASSDIHFDLNNETNNPIDIDIHSQIAANFLVEEFMLLANISVAKQTYQFFPTYALLRRHPTPDISNFVPLVKAAKKYGIDINPENSKTLALSLDKANVSRFPEFNRLLRMLTTRCLTQAVYFASGDYDFDNFLHYGLASSIYTHFTSPIRRYSDLIVHRLLANSLKLTGLPFNLQSRNKVRDICDILNYQHRMAWLCGKSSQELYSLLYFSDKCVESDGIIIDCKKNSVILHIPHYGIEKISYLVNDIKKKTSSVKFCTNTKPKIRELYSNWHLSDDSMSITGSSSSNNTLTYNVFDRVKVVIYVEKLQFHRMKLIVDIIT